jgi:hypothetical protein
MSIWKGLVCGLIVASTPHAASTWPPQLEMHVQFEPTAFPSDGRTYLAYELYLTNFAANPITLRRLDVLDADDSGAAPIVSFEAAQLDALLQPIGPQTASDGSSDHQLAGGRSVVVFLWIALEHGSRLPNHLRQRVTTAEFVAEGAVIATHHTDLLVLGAARDRSQLARRRWPEQQSGQSSPSRNSRLPGSCANFAPLRNRLAAESKRQDVLWRRKR